MGELFRAHDSHLQRTVALEVLSEEQNAASDPDLLLSEARAPRRR